MKSVGFVFILLLEGAIEVIEGSIYDGNLTLFQFK